MLKLSREAIVSLGLIFSLPLIFELPANPQSRPGLPNTNQVSLSCNSNKRLLSKLSEGLLYSSESDYPFQYFSNHQTHSLPSPPEFARLVGQQGQPATQVNFDEFFNRLIKNLHSSGADTATIRRYQLLRQAFKNQFTTLTVYRVGQIQVQVYITGVNSSCGMVGLKTISIET